MIRESSVDYFQSIRAQAFDMSLDQMEKERGGGAAWEAAGPGLDALSALLEEHKVDDGPYVLGSQVSYADFMVVAVLEGFRRIGQDLFDRIVLDRDGLRGVWDACGQWLERDD